MKKVIVFSSVHSWEDTRIFKKQCNSLSKIFDVTYYAPAESSINFSDTFNLIHLPTWKKVSDRKKIRKILFEKIKKTDADIYHFHDPELIFIGLYIKFVKHKKVIYDIHEDVAKQILDKDYIPTKFFRKVVAITYLLLEQIAIRFMDGVIVAGKDIIPKYKSKIVINNYPIVHPYKALQKDNCVVYIGNMSIIYGIYQITEAIKIINEKFRKKIFLKLIGKFDNKKLEDEILVKYGKYIMFMGRQKQEIVYNEVSKSLIGIVNYLPIPNHFNLRSNKLFEYMECSIPVVYPNFGDWTEKLAKYNMGIPVDPLDVNEIAATIDNILDDHEKAFLMGQNGRKAVEKYYNWSNEEKKLLKLYDDLCSL